MTMMRYGTIRPEVSGPSPDRTSTALCFAVLASLAIHGGALLLVPGDDEKGVANFGHGGITVSLGPSGREAGGVVPAAQADSEMAEEVDATETQTVETITPAQPETVRETVTADPRVIEEVTTPEPQAVIASVPAEMLETETVSAMPEPDFVLDAQVADVSDLSAPEITATEVEVIDVETADVAPEIRSSVEPEEVVAKSKATPPPLPKRRPELQKKPLVQETQKAEVAAEPMKSLAPETAGNSGRTEQANDGESQTQTENQVVGYGGKSGDSGLSEAGQGDNTAGGGAPGASSDYYREITAWLEKHKRYPRRSKLRNEEGVVMLRFVVNRDGMVTVSGIKESSGHKRLDKEAMGMIKRAQPLPAMPDDMRQAQLDLVVPVRFHLQ